MNHLLSRLDILINTLNKIYAENVAKEYSVTLLPLEHPDLFYPGLAVCISFKDTPEKGVGWHAIVVQTEVEIQAETRRVGETTYEYQRTPGSVLDRHYMDVAIHTVRSQFKDLPVFDGGAHILPSSFDFDNKAAAFQCAANAVSAATRALQDGAWSSSEAEIELKTMDRRMSVALKVEAGSAGTQRYDACGMPVRSDVTLNLVSSSSPTTGRPPVRDVHITDVSGFFDVIPLPDQKFLPRFVITGLGEKAVGIPTMTQQLLALVSTMVLAENCGWVEPFMKTLAGSSQVNSHSLTWLFGQDVDPTDTKTLRRLIAERFRSGLVFSLDVQNAGADSWRHDLFAAAAQGHQAASDYILLKANVLTDGRFDTYWQRGDQIATTENNVIPFGYYSAAGFAGKRDIRNVDQLFVASHRGTFGVEMTDAWRNTNMQTGYAPEMRLAQRTGIIKTLTGSPTLTDTGLRVSFTQQFMMALMQASRDMGLMIRVPAVEPGIPDYRFPTVVGGQPEEPKPDQFRSGLFGSGYQGQSWHRQSRWG